jgi:hypothetical protein
MRLLTGRQGGTRGRVVPLVPVPVEGGRWEMSSTWTPGSGLSTGSVLWKSKTFFWDVCMYERHERTLPPMQPAQPPEESLPLTPSLWQKMYRSLCVFPLTDELNFNFGLNLDPNPSLEHGAVTLEKPMDKMKEFLSLVALT